jgi:hypothetical protein
MENDICGAVGGMIGKGNRSIRRETAPVPLFPPDQGSNPGHRGGKPANNRLSYGAAYVEYMSVEWSAYLDCAVTRELHEYRNTVITCAVV